MESLRRHIRLEHNYSDFNETRSIEDVNGNTSNIFESETVLEFFIKEEESDDDCHENGPFTNQSSMESNQVDQQMLVEGTDTLYESFTIKQEEVQDDFSGIIGGFLGSSDDAGLLQNEHDNQGQMRDNLDEDHHLQVSTLQLMLMTLSFCKVSQV